MRLGINLEFPLLQTIDTKGFTSLGMGNLLLVGMTLGTT
jgi:hypothetical protein